MGGLYLNLIPARLEHQTASVNDNLVTRLTLREPFDQILTDFRASRQQMERSLCADRLYLVRSAFSEHRYNSLRAYREPHYPVV